MLLIKLIFYTGFLFAQGGKITSVIETPYASNPLSIIESAVAQDGVLTQAMSNPHYRNLKALESQQDYYVRKDKAKKIDKILTFLKTEDFQNARSFAEENYDNKIIYLEQLYAIALSFKNKPNVSLDFRKKA